MCCYYWLLSTLPPICCRSLVTNVKSLPQTVTLEDFTKFCHEHVLLLFPAYEMQTCLIEFFGGKWFWNEIGKRRRHISNGVYMNTKKFMRIYSLGLAEGEGQKQWEFEQERKKALAAGRKKYVINPAASAVVSPELSPTKAKPDHHLIITEKEQSYLLHHSASSPHVSQNEDSRTSTMRRAGSNPKRDSNSPVPRDRRPTDVAGEGAPPAHLKKKPGHHHDKEHKDHHEHHKENPDAFHQKVEMAEGQHGIDIKRTADGSGQTSKASISCSSTSLSESAANSAFSTPHGSIHAKSKSADNGNHHHSAHKKSKGSPGQVMK